MHVDYWQHQIIRIDCFYDTLHIQLNLGIHVLILCQFRHVMHKLFIIIIIIIFWHRQYTIFFSTLILMDGYFKTLYELINYNFDLYRNS